MATVGFGYNPFLAQGQSILNLGGVSQLGAAQGGQIGGASFGGLNIVNMLVQVLQAFSSLAQGWAGVGGAQNPNQFGQPLNTGFFNNGYPQPTLGQQLLYGGNDPFANINGTGQANFGYGGTGTGNVLRMQGPTDPNEFASYLQAQRAGGALSGSTSVSQADAIQGSRFALVPDPEQWHSAVARDYAAQFAAYAVGADPLSAQGLQSGQNAFSNGQLSPDAALFAQVASVFKGNLFNGPGFYDNPGLGQLLQNTGNADLVGANGQVGKTDVQTIGAVIQALNRGSLTLNQVINSGTIDNLDRYNQVINFVQSGAFANDIQRYETARI